MRVAGPFGVPVPDYLSLPRLHLPLIEPDRQISRIRLSDKTSRLHPRHVVPKPAQAYEPEVPVKVREWISSALASPDLVLEAQPPAQPHSGVVIERPVRLVVNGGQNPRKDGGRLSGANAGVR